MSDTKYKVVGKEFSGIEISSMLIENEEGKRKKDTYVRYSKASTWW